MLGGFDAQLSMSFGVGEEGGFGRRGAGGEGRDIILSASMGERDGSDAATLLGLSCTGVANIVGV